MTFGHTRPVHSDKVHDCACGLRYLRHAVSDDQRHIGTVMCSCGRCLECYDGFYSLDYEPEERTGYLH